MHVCLLLILCPVIIIVVAPEILYMVLIKYEVMKKPEQNYRIKHISPDRYRQRICRINSSCLQRTRKYMEYCKIRRLSGDSGSKHMIRSRNIQPMSHSSITLRFSPFSSNGHAQVEAGIACRKTSVTHSTCV